MNLINKWRDSFNFRKAFLNFIIVYSKPKELKFTAFRIFEKLWCNLICLPLLCMVSTIFDIVRIQKRPQIQTNYYGIDELIFL